MHKDGHKIIVYDTIVVGTGAAGYNAAVQLKKRGVDCAVVTEGVNCGTSRNTGSDKQTYYKLSLASAEDSVDKMASDLFSGGCVDGDNAMCEAALSARCFFHLCDIGVPFPDDEWGRFTGYKTDHDTRRRATSAGPLTSKFMTEALEREAESLGIPVYDGYLVYDIIKSGTRALGVAAYSEKDGGIVLFRADNVVWACGGEAGIYSDTVYPVSHHGSAGVLFLAGAAGQNLTEWQYGIASVSPRWNVSGTYMQVLPRFVSIDSDGNEHEFLLDYFTECGKSVPEYLAAVFRKGYEWPFDCDKVMDGSSVTDLLVYREEKLYGREVYLDFIHNPTLADEIDYDALPDECGGYLREAGAEFGFPIDRLEHMNPPAIELYASKGVDLHTQYLKISLCAQHNNGGAAVDEWWKSSVPHLYVCGEAAGTHGIKRPGGSALNAGQAGSLRAAIHISRENGKECAAPCTDEEFITAARESVKLIRDFSEQGGSDAPSAAECTDEVRRGAARCAGAMRDVRGISALLDRVRELYGNIGGMRGTVSEKLLLRSTLAAELAYLSAMRDYAARKMPSRGSFIVLSADGVLREGLDESFRFIRDGEKHPELIQQVTLDEKSFSCRTTWREVRPLPPESGMFENVWREYRRINNIK